MRAGIVAMVTETSPVREAANVTVETDAAGNIKPSKKKSTERIDGIVAGVMALGRALLDLLPTSVTPTRGLFWKKGKRWVVLAQTRVNGATVLGAPSLPARWSDREAVTVAPLTPNRIVLPGALMGRFRKSFVDNGLGDCAMSL